MLQQTLQNIYFDQKLLNFLKESMSANEYL